MFQSIKKKKKVLAVSSSGGHWVQMMRLRPAWDSCVTCYLTTEPIYKTDVIRYARERDLEEPLFYTSVAASRWNKSGLIRQFFTVAWVVMRVRPDVVISTGASIGWFAIVFGKILGAKTLWIDSIANVERLSLSGEKAGLYADKWLTQWPHLASSTPKGAKNIEKKPDFWGSIL